MHLLRAAQSWKLQPVTVAAACTHCTAAPTAALSPATVPERRADAATLRPPQAQRRERRRAPMPPRLTWQQLLMHQSLRLLLLFLLLCLLLLLVQPSGGVPGRWACQWQ